MKSAALFLVVWCAWGVAASAHASSRDEKRACVEASTHGQTARDEGRLLEAREHLLVCARDACPQVVRKSCGSWLGELDHRTPSVLIRVTDASDEDVTDAEVRIDDVPALLDGRPIPLDPGQHVVRASAPDGTTVTRKFLLAENEKSRVVGVRLGVPVKAREPAAEANASPGVRDERPPAQMPPTQQAPRRFVAPLGSWILGGVGVVALGTATGFGIAAVSERRELARTCGREVGKCSESETRSARRNARVTDVSLAVGAGALVGAAAWAAYVWSRGPSHDGGELALVPTRQGAVAAYARQF